MLHSYNALQPFLKYTKSFNDMAKAYYTPGQKGWGELYVSTIWKIHRKNEWKEISQNDITVTLG